MDDDMEQAAWAEQELQERRHLEERFWAKVSKGDGESCWEWKASKHRNGYGQFSYGHRKPKINAHRFAWIATRGDIPVGLFVCHRCDNPACVRPDHLFLGTPQENVDDKVKKGRSINPPVIRGSAVAISKLKEQQVLEIRTSVEPSKALAERYGVAECTIRKIRAKTLWAWL